MATALATADWQKPPPSPHSGLHHEYFLAPACARRNFADYSPGLSAPERGELVTSAHVGRATSASLRVLAA